MATKNPQNKIQFFVGYPDDKHYTLTINYKANDTANLQHVVSINILKSNDINELNKNINFNNFKDLYLFLKTLSNDANFSLNIALQNIIIDKLSDAQNIEKKNQELANKFAPLENENGYKKGISASGGAKKRKQSNATKRRNKQSNKTRRQ